MSVMQETRLKNHNKASGVMPVNQTGVWKERERTREDRKKDRECLMWINKGGMEGVKLKGWFKKGMRGGGKSKGIEVERDERETNQVSKTDAVSQTFAHQRQYFSK